MSSLIFDGSFFHGKDLARQAGLLSFIVAYVARLAPFLIYATLFEKLP